MANIIVEHGAGRDPSLFVQRHARSAPGEEVASIRLWQRMGATGLNGSLCGSPGDGRQVYALGAPAPDAAMFPTVVDHHLGSQSREHLAAFRAVPARGAARGRPRVVIDPRRTTRRAPRMSICARDGDRRRAGARVMHVLFAEAFMTSPGSALTARLGGAAPTREDYSPDRVAPSRGPC